MRATARKYRYLIAAVIFLPLIAAVAFYLWLSWSFRNGPGFIAQDCGSGTVHVEGTVQDETRIPIVGAQIKIHILEPGCENSLGGTFQLRSYSQGKFAGDIPVTEGDSFTLTASAKGFQDYQNTYWVYEFI